MKAVAWPENQPGWTATAPPLTGQRVRLLDVGMPPPVAFISVQGRADRKWCLTYKDSSIACRMAISPLAGYHSSSRLQGHLYRILCRLSAGCLLSILDM